jgi:ATP-dependent Lhr-like helicase
LKVKDSHKRIICHKCGGKMVAALSTYDRENVRLIKKEKLSEEEENEVRRIFKNASLVNRHGKKALLALAGRGVGPDTAARVLSGFYDDEDGFLRDILSAEINYAKTKRFWD